MPERFFSIPLANNADLVALQDYLKTKPALANATWQDPANFHITLVFVQDGDTDLSEIGVPSSLPAFGLGGDYLRVFETPEGAAITLSINSTPQLTYLQAALFYELRALGLAISTFSWPALYQPHITLATMPVGTDEYFSIPQMVHLMVDRFELTGNDYQAFASYELVTSAPGGGPVQEMVHVHDVLTVWEMRGNYPEVAIHPKVDIKELTAGDDDPTYVTLPIGKANVTSGNRRHYGEDFLEALERQVFEQMPIGIFGHISEEDRATAFPHEDVHWVGAKRVGELLWGKGYVPPGDGRDRLRRYKAQNKKIATSIDAYLEGSWDASLKAYRMDGTTLELHQIDFAPVDRAGIPELGAVPHLTQEMNGKRIQHVEDLPMDLNDIRSLKREDAQHLPQEVRESVMAEAPSAKTVQEMRSELGLDDNADVVAAVKEMAESVRKQREGAVEARIKELAEDKEKGIKLESMRGLVMELVAARQPKSVEDVDRIYGEVIASERVKGALQETVQVTMGPAAGRPVAGQQGGAKYFNIPEDSEDKK
jgi:2'-5' RNA ligase